MCLIYDSEMAQDDSRYTKPEMRERIKDRIMAGSKKQKDLKRWGKEKWMTRKEYEKKKDD